MTNLLNKIIKKILIFKRLSIDFFLDCLFPTSCAACKLTLDTSEKQNRLCRDCLGSIIIKRTPEKIGSVKVYSPLSYRDPQAKGLIHRLKYEFDRGSAMPLARLVVAHLKISGFTEEVKKDAVIVPIPLHKKRLAERGFNQAELIAVIAGQLIGLPVLPNALRRSINTTPQSQLEGRLEREKNISGCFIPGREAPLVKGKIIVLLDDIWTSGATMKEAASVLRIADAKKIIFVSVAFAG